MQNKFITLENQMKHTRLFHILRHRDHVCCVCFSPNGKFLASGSKDRSIELWDVQSGRQILTFKGHEDHVLGVCFSPDGHFLASSSREGLVIVWDTETGRQIRKLDEITRPSWDISFSPNGQYLASGSLENTVHLWEVNKNFSSNTLVGHTGKVISVAFSPDGQLLASGSEDTTVRLWKLPTGRSTGIRGDHDHYVRCIRFSPDNQFLISASTDGVICLRHLTVQSSHVIHDSQVSGICISPDSKSLVSCGSEGTIRLWEVETGEKIYEETMHKERITGIDFSPNGLYIATGSHDNSVRLSDISETKSAQTGSVTSEKTFQNLLDIHMKTLILSHTITPTPSRPSAWLRGAGSMCGCVPLFLVQDIGNILTQTRDHLRIGRPAHIPGDIDTSFYLDFLERLSGYPMLAEIGAWNISETIAGIMIARLINGVEFPEIYQVPVGTAGIDFARQLGVRLDRAEASVIWRETDPGLRPDLRQLLPSKSMAEIEKNLRKLDIDELRFLHRYGPRITGAPDPEEMLDLFNLTGLPPSVRMAMSQMLRLLPKISQIKRTGGVQTYAMGGYEGLTHKGSLDSLIPTELANPADILFHRLLNKEALYYGREGTLEQGKEMAFIITQSGIEMYGDYFVLAQGLTLALAQAMQNRGYEVRHSFAGSTLTSPAGTNRASDVHRILYYRDEETARHEKILNEVSKLLKAWKEKYRSIQVFWVVNEFWDADDWDLHTGLYKKLKTCAGQQVWFIRCGDEISKEKGRMPDVSRQFHRCHIVNTGLMWQDNKPPLVDYARVRKLVRRAGKKPGMDHPLRSEPLEVSVEDANRVFEMTEAVHELGFKIRRPVEYFKNEYEPKGDIVIDHASSIMWQKAGSENEMNYENAAAYVKQLNEKLFAGYEDWRLPTVDELASLLEAEKQSNGLYIDPIFDAAQRWCWTADKRVGGGAWDVNFNYGYVYWTNLGYNNYVRVCRA
ncbi:DUF1566 domain-containing protein [Desulfobacterales bacterium HSG16]|nr:DUF1566 domain-containing protein [Desulfobacterales bacterium HSG16]